MSELAALQALLLAAVDGQEGARTAVCARVRGRPDRPPEQQLEVVLRGVAGAFRGALDTRYPAVARVLGERAWAEVRALASAQPQAPHPDLGAWGGHLARVLEEIEQARGAQGRPWLAQLAALEWAVAQAGQVEPPQVRDLSWMSGLLPEEQDQVRIRRQPGVRVLVVDWGVHLLWAEGAAEPAAGRQALVVSPAPGDRVSVLPIPEDGLRFLEQVLRAPSLGALTESLGPSMGLLPIWLPRVLQAGWISLHPG